MIIIILKMDNLFFVILDFFGVRVCPASCAKISFCYACRVFFCYIVGLFNFFLFFPYMFIDFLFYLMYNRCMFYMNFIYEVFYMSATNKTFKLQVAVSFEMLEKIDFYSQKMGVSRSALCAMLISQGIMNYDNAKSLFDNLDFNSIVSSLVSSGKLDNLDSFVFDKSDRVD